MLISIKDLDRLQKIKVNEKRDVCLTHHAIENDIRLLSSEILRLSKLPYRSWGNLDKIRRLDDQIQYLEHMLAAYERDLKKYE